MSLVKAYTYLFYRNYMWELRAFGKRNNPKLVSTLWTSFCVYLNLLTVVEAYEIIEGHALHIEKPCAIGLALTILLIHYVTSFAMDDCCELLQSSPRKLKSNGDKDLSGIGHISFQLTSHFLH